MNATNATPASVSTRMREEVERAFQRTVKGFAFLTAPEPPVGLTPKHVLHHRGTQRVVHYLPMADEVYRVPVLLIVPPSNRGYGMDMLPGQSLVEFLLKAGFDVYMLEYTEPRRSEARLSFDDYVLRFLADAVQRVLRDSGETQLSLLGYCAAGVMAACYAALTTQGPVANLVCLTTPADFHQMEMHRNLTDPRYFDVDRAIDANGMVPGEAFLLGATMLRPVTPIAERMRLWDNMWNDEYVTQFRRFDGWASDTLPLPGAYMRQLIKELMIENRLLRGEFVLGGRRVDLGAITIPFLHVVAEHDHLVPRGASQPLIGMIGSADKEEIVLKGGHLSVVTGPNARTRLWPKLEAWLGERSA